MRREGEIPSRASQISTKLPSNYNVKTLITTKEEEIEKSQLQKQGQAMQEQTHYPDYTGQYLSISI